MAQPNEAISSARTKIFLTAANAPTIPPGIVEDISFSPVYASENLIGVGDIRPMDNVVNNTQGSIRFSAIFRDDPSVNDILRPRLENFVRFFRFDVLVIDALDNRTIVVAKGCLPTSFDITMTPGRAARLSYSGISQVILIGNEDSRALPR